MSHRALIEEDPSFVEQFQRHEFKIELHKEVFFCILDDLSFSDFTLKMREQQQSFSRVVFFSPSLLSRFNYLSINKI